MVLNVNSRPQNNPINNRSSPKRHNKKPHLDLASATNRQQTNPPTPWNPAYDNKRSLNLQHRAIRPHIIKILIPTKSPNIFIKPSKEQYRIHKWKDKSDWFENATKQWYDDASLVIKN